MPHLGRARDTDDAAVGDLWLTCRWLKLEEESHDWFKRSLEVGPLNVANDCTAPINIDFTILVSARQFRAISAGESHPL